MTGWLGKIFGKSSPTNASVSNDQTKALRTIFSKLDSVDSDLPDRALRYVVAGQQEDVLGQLAASTDAAKLLGIKGAKAVGVGHGEADDVLFTSAVEDPLVYVRLGRLYEAASRTCGVHRTLTWNSGAPIWLELLLWEASNHQPNTYLPTVEIRLSHASIEQILAAAGEPPDLLLREWHPSQKIRNVDGGIILTMNVAGSVEVASWVLSFGDEAKVLEPESLRDQVAGELRRAAMQY